MASVVAAWPAVALRELMTQDTTYVSELEPRMYPKISVKWWGKGAVPDAPTDGAMVRMARHQLAKPGQVIVSEIWAKHGSIGIVPPECAGGLVTSHFYLFDIDVARLAPRYMDYVIQANYLTSYFEELARGTTGYASVRPKDFLAAEIPLPPLDEQRRIVGRIEALAARIEQARGLRREAMAEGDAIWKAAINAEWADENRWSMVPVRELAQVVSGQVDPQVEPFASLPHINGEFIEPTTCRLLNNYRTAQNDGVTSGKFHFYAGAVLYSKIRPYLMKAAQVTFEGICSADIYAFQTFNPAITARFFMYSLVSPRFTKYANDLSGRTRMPKLNQDQLFAFQMSYPSLAEQERIVAYLDGLLAQIGALKRFQGETAAELDALLPAVLDQAFRGEL